MSLLAQLGVVGYDQWQVSGNGGNYLVAGIPVAASRLPYYSVHAIGVQANVILPAKNLVGFFKYYDEYRALARPQGRTKLERECAVERCQKVRSNLGPNAAKLGPKPCTMTQNKARRTNKIDFLQLPWA